LARAIIVAVQRIAMQEMSETSYVFIPGKNWRLSLAELVAFLSERKLEFTIKEFSPEFFTVEIEATADEVRSEDFGGVIKIGSVKTVLKTELLQNFFARDDKAAKAEIRRTVASSKVIDLILSKAIGKILFGVSVYCAHRPLRGFSRRIQRFVGSAVKTELRAEGAKSDFMGFSGHRQFPQLTHVEVLKKQLIDKGAEVLICIGKERTLMATTLSVHNPFEFQKRDIKKPVERRIFAMPPRLARIMVNLAGCHQGKTFLDPFCGVGTILLEALLSGAEVVGADTNPWCVKASRENLEWLAREYELKSPSFAVLIGDARKLSPRIRNVDCIATEPDLGPALRENPTNAYATKIVTKLEPLFFSFMEDAFEVLSDKGRLVLVTPYFQTRSGKPVPTRFAEKAEEIGFKRLYPFKKEHFTKEDDAENRLIGLTSIVDVAERHKVGREINVFQKSD
jgi:tRNA G10  N-methylase Trm11